MLEAINIFTKGGMILFSWSLSFASLKGNPVEALIRTCLLEERSGEEADDAHTPRDLSAQTVTHTRSRHFQFCPA